MTAAAVLPRSHHTRTTPAASSLTPLTCSCACVMAAWRPARPAAELAIPTIPRRSFLT